MRHLRVTSGSHARHGLAAGVLGRDGRCSSMRAVWVQLARQVRMSIDWLKGFRVGIVSETRERSRTWEACHWCAAMTRGSTSGLKLCAGGLCSCRSRAPIDRRSEAQGPRVEWRSHPFNLKRRRCSRPMVVCHPIRRVPNLSARWTRALGLSTTDHVALSTLFVVTQAMCTAVFVTQTEKAYSLVAGCLGPQHEAGHREDFCVAGHIAGSRRQGTPQKFMRASMVILSHAQRLHFWAAMALPVGSLQFL